MGSQVVSAETLSFSQLLAEALENSFDLKIAQEDIAAGQAFVREQQADYYPQLSLRFGNDYVHAFGQQNGVASGGNIVIADESSYRHSLITSLDYNLFDFGVRRLTVANARRQVLIADLGKKQAFWKIRKELLRLFAEGLKIQKQLSSAESVLARQNTIYRLSKQLRQAGTLGREQLGSAALTLAETLSRQTELQIQFQQALGRLTFYTQQTYSAAEIHLADLAPPQKENLTLNLDTAPEVQIFSTRIENKLAELSVAKRAMLPKLQLSAYHRLFGSDMDSFSKSLTNLSARDATISLTFDWPLFSGFADIAKIERLNHELSSLRYQKEKKRAELQEEAAQTTNAYDSFAATVNQRLNNRGQIAKERLDAERLAAQRLTDQISFQQKMIGLTRQQLEVDLREVDYAVSAISLVFLQEATL